MKQPPHSLESEQFVLGGLILNNAAIADVAARLTPEDFYREDHQTIFRALLGMSDARKPVDFGTLVAHLQGAGDLDAAGGLAYIGSLANDTPGAANVMSYAETVRERSLLRKLIASGSATVESCYRPEGRGVGELIDSAEKALFDIRGLDRRGNGSAMDLSHVIELAERGIELRRQSGDAISGLRTGIRGLDDLTTGLHPGDLIIVAGRPSMGKTAFALNVAEFCVFEQKKPALVFSMEMPAEQLALRVMASRARVGLQELRSGQMGQDAWDRLGDKHALLRSGLMRIDETPALTPQDLRARARREHSRRPLGVVVVDYIQLMQCAGKENRTNEVSEISRNLKALAKELHVPIIALSQLNRSLESRENKRPRMSDLRESGGIEQDADLIAFIYRDEVYNANSPDAGTAEIIVAKQRNGPLGMVRASFLGQFCRFENLAHDWTAAPQAAPARPRRGFGSTHAAHALGDAA